MRARLLLIALVGAAGLAAAEPGQALACSCAGPTPGKEGKFYRDSLRAADGAIVGKLLRVRPIGETHKANYVYRLTRVFKERRLAAGQILRVKSARDGAACGIEQRIGTRGGLFLDRRAGRWHSSLCAQVSPAALRKAARQVGSSGSSAGSAGVCGGQATV